VVLVAVASGLLVSIGIGVGVFAFGGSSSAPAAKVTISKPVMGDVPPGLPKNYSATAAAAFNRASIKLAGELATPQTIANVFEVSRAMEQFKR
jgi:hypothetical protein